MKRTATTTTVLSRAAAAAAAITVTVGMLAAVDALTDPHVLSAAATGETTAHGPVVRLPAIEVTGRRPLSIALPDLFDRGRDRFAARERNCPDA